MISTIEIKRDRFQVFRTGNPQSKEVIFVMGSCRVVPYINYLEIWNRSVGGNRFLIYAIDPYDFCWDDAGNRVDLESTIKALENNNKLLEAIRSTRIFVHEYFSHFGMFNVDRSLPKHIYQFGMAPETDVMIPNFHDVFILFNDFAKFPPFQNEARAVRGHLTEDMLREIKSQAAANIARFCDVCRKTDLPSMEQFFLDNYLTRRLFWTFNHITKHFALEIWRLMNRDFLKLECPESFQREIDPLEFVSDPRTPICQYDVEQYGFNLNEPVVDFSKHNKFR